MATTPALLPSAPVVPQKMWGTLFSLGLLWNVMGTAVTFAPGDFAQWWYVVGACMMLAGLGISHWGMRIFAVVMVGSAVWLAVLSHQANVVHQEVVKSEAHVKQVMEEAVRQGK